MALLAALLAAPAAAQRWAVVDPGQGPVALPSGDTAAAQLSGLAWAGGERYYAVSDADPLLHPLRIAVDPRDGSIRSALLEPGVRLPGSRDLEGVVIDAAGNVLVSDEVGPAIRRYRPADGAGLGVVPLPPVFAGARKNLGLESLALSADGRTLWTANEEALRSDGPPSTFTAGTLVRLQRFAAQRRPSPLAGQGGDGGSAQRATDTPLQSEGSDRAWHPDAQWAYRTDPIPGDVLRPGRDVEASGVVEIIALPDGTLLVLERAYGAVGTRSRLYEVDVGAATDTGAGTSPNAPPPTPVHKTLLWERTFPDANFEGAALGPRLASGGRSLVLVSDDGHALRQALYGLEVRARPAQ